VTDRVDPGGGLVKYVLVENAADDDRDRTGKRCGSLVYQRHGLMPGEQEPTDHGSPDKAGGTRHQHAH